MSGGPRSSGRFRDWREANPDAFPSPWSDPDPEQRSAARPPSPYGDAQLQSHSAGAQPYGTTGHPTQPAQPYGTTGHPTQPAQPYGTTGHPTARPRTPAAATTWAYDETRVRREPRRPQRPPRGTPAADERAMSYRHGSPQADDPAGYHTPATINLEGVIDYRYAPPSPSHQHPPSASYRQGTVPRPDPWDRSPTGQLRGPNEGPGPWPTRVSWPSAIVTVALLVLVGTVGAVGLPRLLRAGADEEEFEATTLTRPAEVAGLPRLPDAEVTAEDKRAAEQLLSPVRTALATQVAVYARKTGVRLTVVAGRPATALTDRELEILRTGFSAGMESAKAPVSQLSSGPLGGWFGCGQVEHGATLCLAMDAGAIVSIAVTSDDPSAIALAQVAREAVEHRDP
jgi:hypothetical protein